MTRAIILISVLGVLWGNVALAQDKPRQIFGWRGTCVSVNPMGLAVYIEPTMEGAKVSVIRGFSGQTVATDEPSVSTYERNAKEILFSGKKLSINVSRSKAKVSLALVKVSDNASENELIPCSYFEPVEFE
jgi:hypothetical protein